MSDELFNTYRPMLLGLAYRMLGSIMDAEDCVQDAYIRWQKIDASSIVNPQTYLATTITRLSIDHLRSAQVRREQYVGVWLPEPLLTSEESNDPASITVLAESLSQAFLVMLERLSPLERAVLLLHQVFDYSYSEIAEILERTEESCRQIGHRTQQHLSAHRQRFQADQKQRDLLTEQFLQACTIGNLEGLIAMLSQDVILYSDGGGKVHAAINPIEGPESVARFILGLVKKLSSETQTLVHVGGNHPTIR